MRKIKFFVDLDKEERWLNEMAKQGYVLTGKSMGYTFDKDEHNQAVIRIDYRTFKRKEDFNNYLTLFEDSGWTHLSGTKQSGSQYFMKNEHSSTEDIFSDVDSKAGRYKRLADMWASLASGFAPLMMILIITDTIDPLSFMNPKSFYYTPGLWDKAGADFWQSFLFETPFALFRGFGWWFIVLTVVLSLLFHSMAKKQYKRTRENAQ
jgi:hypothetical protein